MIKKCISVTSHALGPPPPVTNCHTYSDPLPSSVTCFMDGPLLHHVSPSLLLLSSTAASVDLCRHHSFHGVFVLSSYHTTIPFQPGLSYFVSNACHHRIFLMTSFLFLSNS